MPLTVTRASGDGPMTAVIRQLFEHPETYLKGKKAVVISVGSSFPHEDTAFCNICLMDRENLHSSGKNHQGPAI